MALLDVTAITGQEENTDQCLQEPQKLNRMCHRVSGWASGLYGVFTGKCTQHPILEPGATDDVNPVHMCMHYIIRGHPIAEEDNEGSEVAEEMEAARDKSALEEGTLVR